MGLVAFVLLTMFFHHHHSKRRAAGMSSGPCGTSWHEEWHRQWARKVERHDERRRRREERKDEDPEKVVLRRARMRAAAVIGFYGHLASYVGVIALLFVINMLTSPTRPWFLWPAFGWGIGVK